MYLVVQTSKHDAGQLPDLAKVISKFGPYRGHKLIVAHGEGIEQQAAEFRKELENQFDEAVTELTLLQVTGWPLAPNRQARMIFELMQAKYNDQHWLLMEPDLIPVRQLWLQDIDSEYRKAGKLYMGAVVPTRIVKRLPDGQIERSTSGTHLVGAGAVFPPHAFARSVLMPNVDRQMPWSHLPLEPWDTRCRDEFSRSLHGTHLVAHHWGTVNYRRTGDQLVCDNDPKNPEGTDHSGVVSPSAAVVHGCKDGTLARLVLGGYQATETAPPPIPHHTEAAIESLANAELPKPVPADFTTYKIRKAILANDGANCSKIAEVTGLDEEKIKEFVRRPDSGLRLGPRGRIVIIVKSEFEKSVA